MVWSLAPTAMNIKAASATPPSAASLADCPKTCGDVSIWYPFGVGPGCFRQGFELICDTATQPHKLFLGNTTTQVTSLFPSGTVLASVMYTIPPMMLGTGTYNLSWESPGRNLNIVTYNYLAFLGCGIGVYLFHPDTGDLVGHCTVKCASVASMTVATEGGICNGMGCCSVTFPVLFRGFKVTIVRNNETVPEPFANITIKAFLTFHSYKFSIADLLSDKINASTVGASFAYLSTVITDKPNCTKALSDDNTQYACGSSDCVDVPNGGYSCICSGSSDDGNPYLPDDCKQDDGLLYVNKLSEFEDANTKYLSVYYGGSGYFSQQLVYGLDKSDLSEEFAVWRWSATNLTCENAKSGSAYACRSTNSECLGVTNGKLYIGYRCKCSLGFEGNPYVQNGCIDLNKFLVKEGK
ncbi:hypothetical protein ACQ4PT_002477 [Festuca glaucescens]